MSPRPYRMEQRRVGVDATRQRIIEAARRVLVSGDPFSIEAAAREAGVARLTIYAHFGAREVLLEAVFDDLAESGGLTQLPEAFSEPDPVKALERFVTLFCGFYSVHRVLLRRLHALAVLGRGDDVLGERNARRWQGLEVLLGRIAAAGHPGADATESINVAHALTSFAFVDELGGTEADADALAARIVALVKAASHVADQSAGSET